ncbi:unnamed protein product [Adineta ricciae]|uniref:Uncharacterized protein n=1 Tax=Adineta ricciae TaxID=249248 RepID=A0A814DI60_ADIRI|nr:unnamed protein product [Adineta ricciae]
MPPQKRRLFQVNRHVQASIMLLSVMDGAEFDLNNTSLSSSPKTTPTAASAATTTTTISTTDDYDKDLQLAAELGRCLLERNQELQTYIGVLQKQIDDEQCDIKLLHAKLESTREQLDSKCKQTELLDATNFDLERELLQQRRENERERQRVKELSDLCEKTRKQCLEIEHEYGRFRSKQLSTQFYPKPITSHIQSSTIPPAKSRLRRHSQSTNVHPIQNSSPSSNIFDVSSASVFKTHLTELKSRIKSLTSECSTLNDKLHQSEQEKQFFINRMTLLERQHRDDIDSLQNELNHYKKLLEKQSNDPPSTIFSPMFSTPEHDVSLYDEVLFENKKLHFKSSYEPTNYKDLFASVYAKLKSSVLLCVHSSSTCTMPRFVNLSVPSNFSIQQFLGVWYEIEEYFDDSQDEFDEVYDFTQSFELEHNSSEFLLVYGKARFVHEEQCFSFGPWLLNINNSARMILDRKDLNTTTSLNWPYYVLKTDYEHYLLIYSCTTANYLVEHICEDAILWVFSRTRSLASEYSKELNEYIEKSLCINTTNVKKMSHGTKSCYMTNSAPGTKFSSVEIRFCFIVLILYLFLIYK